MEGMESIVWYDSWDMNESWARCGCCVDDESVDSEDEDDDDDESEETGNDESDDNDNSAANTTDRRELTDDVAVNKSNALRSQLSHSLQKVCSSSTLHKHTATFRTTLQFLWFWLATLKTTLQFLWIWLAMPLII